MESVGTVVGWGSNAEGETDSLANASNVVALAGGNEFSLALRDDAQVIVVHAFEPMPRFPSDQEARR